MNVFTFFYSSQALSNTTNIKDTIKNNPPKIVYVQAKDGYTPVKGKDYFDGAAGLNAMSFSVVNTVIKEVPLMGERGIDGKDGVDGKNGQDAPYQEIRINDETGDLETKLNTTKFWETLIPCSNLQVGCPQ